MAIAQVQDDGSKGFGQKISEWPTQAREYVQDLRMEMRRVTWPAWKQVRATTVVVVAAVFGFAAYFFVVDALLGKGITKLFDTLTR
jgi:preprotein translocase subunit SecE